MKKLTTLLLAVIMVLSLAACGNSTGGGNGAVVETPKGPIYTVDASEVDPNIYPDDYPLIAFADFEAAFEVMKAANLKSEMKDYQDFVDIFGIDGAYYENCDNTYDNQLYKYYGWYADNGANMIITFKANGNDLEFYAYVSNGVY